MYKYSQRCDTGASCVLSVASCLRELDSYDGTRSFVYLLTDNLHGWSAVLNVCGPRDAGLIDDTQRTSTCMRCYTYRLRSLSPAASQRAINLTCMQPTRLSRQAADQAFSSPTSRASVDSCCSCGVSMSKLGSVRRRLSECIRPSRHGCCLDVMPITTCNRPSTTMPRDV